jgi:DnaJ family protein C protein 9
MASPQDEFFDDAPLEINPYEVLSIEKTATPDEIKSAYRKAALKHHPGMLNGTTPDTFLLNFILFFSCISKYPLTYI